MNGDNESITSTMSQSQKRPRADTQSQNPPERRMAWVDESANFTLFDEGNMSDIDRTLFDGQLSDLTDSDLEEFSDGGSEFPPLTASGSESELELDEGNAALISPLGSWEGVRKAQNAYRLGASENLKGPDVEGLDLRLVNLKNEEKEVMKRFVGYLVRHWPSSQLNANLVASRSLALADATAFLNALFTPQFKNFIDFLNDTPVANRSTRVCLSKNLVV